MSTRVRWRIILLGKVLEEGIEEFDGPPEEALRRITYETYDGLDIGERCRQGKAPVWAEATIL